MARGLYERTPETRAKTSAAAKLYWERVRAGELPMPKVGAPVGTRKGIKQAPEHTERIRQGLYRYNERRRKAGTPHPNRSPQKILAEKIRRENLPENSR